MDVKRQIEELIHKAMEDSDWNPAIAESLFHQRLDQEPDLKKAWEWELIEPAVRDAIRQAAKELGIKDPKVPK